MRKTRKETTLLEMRSTGVHVGSPREARRTALHWGPQRERSRTLSCLGSYPGSRAALVAALAAASLGAPALAAEAGDSFAVRDVLLFDGERAHEHRTVVVANGRIARIGGPELEPGGARVVDGRGRTLLPGLIDAHVHVPDDAEQALRQAASLGVTTVLDMFSGGERFARLKRLAAEDPPHLASLLTAGVGATAPGGHPTQMGGPPLPTVGGAAEAQAFVDARIAEGSDYIKIIYDDMAAFGFDPPLPMLGKEALAALVAAAHHRGKLAVVHVGSERQARDAIEAGADGLVHLFTGEAVAADFGQLVRRHGAFVVPTLSLLYAACGASEGPGLLADERLAPFIAAERRRLLTMKWRPTLNPCKAAEESIRQLLAAGAPILAGTDAPVPGTTYGASLHGELALLVRNGLTPLQALAAATSVPARAFGLGDRGSIREGLRADLVLVDGDPTRDVLATRNIVSVWKRGMEVQRERVP